MHLLEAEFHSDERNSDAAKIAYNAAITASRTSKFVNEQGLASERAGFHYKRNGQTDLARDFFLQSRECYLAWGSQLKVDYIDNQIELLK